MSPSEHKADKVSSNEKVLKAKAKHEEIKARKEVERAARQAAGGDSPAAAPQAAAVKPVNKAARVSSRVIVRQDKKPAVVPVALTAASRGARLLAALSKPIVKQNGKKRVVPK